MSISWAVQKKLLLILPVLVSDTLDKLYALYRLQPSGQCLYAAHDSHI